jgi:RNA polymerase sigma factor (sigma-70 family)
MHKGIWIMLTYEQCKTSLHKWAHHYSCPQFEHWDLIGAVWERGYVQQLPSVKLVSSRVRYDMLDYMRSTTQSRIKKRYADKDKHFPETAQISTFQRSDDKKNYIGIGIGSSFDAIARFETLEFFVWLTADLDPKCQLIFLLYYLENMTMSEIGDIMGKTVGRISQIHALILSIVKRKLLKHGFGVRKCNRKILPYSISIYRKDYNHHYYRFYNRKESQQA